MVVGKLTVRIEVFAVVDELDGGAGVAAEAITAGDAGIVDPAPLPPPEHPANDRAANAKTRTAR
jgi:hypothetical protein